MSTVRKVNGREQAGSDEEVYIIKDTPKILICMLVAGACFIGAAAALVSGITERQPAMFTVTFLAAAGGAIFYGITKANMGGIVLDLKNDILEFPGGGVAANDITDYIKPDFLMQIFKRHQVPISAIREITSYEEHTRKRDKDGRVTDTFTPYIKFNGDFGAVSIRFASEGKRDELYSILREVNEMGIPVVNQ